MEERSLRVIDISMPLLLKNKSVRNPCGTSLPIVAKWATHPFGDKFSIRASMQSNGVQIKYWSQPVFTYQ